MELAKIRYFLAVCEARGFTRAAAICGIAQPSLSTAVRRLEKEVGGRLFDRGPPVRLSPLGEAVKPHFEAILREADKIRRLGTGATEGAMGFPNGLNQDSLRMSVHVGHGAVELQKEEKRGPRGLILSP